jgi:hypothetical protein
LYSAAVTTRTPSVSGGKTVTAVAAGFCFRIRKLVGMSLTLMLADFKVDFDSTKVQVTGVTDEKVFAMIAVSFVAFY